MYYSTGAVITLLTFVVSAMQPPTEEAEGKEGADKAK
jgi:hypothetical protein